MSISDAPCYHCKDRSITCHGVCDRYKAVKARKDLENKLRRQEASANLSCSRTWGYGHKIFRG